MNLLVFSDVHGSLPTAERILDITANIQPEAVLLLGDILYHGPRNPLPEGYQPKAAAERLAALSHRIIAVRGNCDSEVDSQVLSFPLAAGFSWILTPGRRIFMTHGHRFTPDAPPPLLPGDVFLFGHTHVPRADVSPHGIFVCNPGSPSLPKEGHPPTYGHFCGQTFFVRTLDNEVRLRLSLA